MSARPVGHKETDALIRTLLREHGFIQAANNKHIKLRSPDGQVIVLSRTPSGDMARIKQRAELKRRFGITL